MAATGPCCGHNVRVNPLPARHRQVLLAAPIALALVLAGCGGGGEAASKPTKKPSATAPTGKVDVPSGTTLTEPGAELTFGRPATVAYEANPKRGTVLTMTVASARQGVISDLAAYQLGAATKSARPYYVRATVTNDGPGDLSRLGVPLYGVDQSNTLIPPATFNNTFAPCPSAALPAGFTSGKTAAGCLVYLVPDGGTLTSVSYRPSQKYAGITWSGTIQPPPAAKKPAKAKKSGKKAQS